MIGSIQRGEGLHQRWFTRARRTHNRGELTPLKINSDIIQGVYSCLTPTVGFEQVLVDTAGVSVLASVVVMPLIVADAYRKTPTILYLKFSF